MKSYCIKCNRETNQKVLKEEKANFYEEESTWWEDHAFQIIQCMGCDELSFRKLYNDAQMQHGEEEDTTNQELYPKRGAHSRPIKPFFNLPYEITAVYRETIDTYNNNLKLLCGVGIRAILEGICIDKAITGGKVKTSTGTEKNSKNLDGKIAGLAAKGYLTVDNSESLHELRFLGNEAVHKLTIPDIEELRLAIDIIELIIENIYEIRHKALKLKAKRTDRKK
ncbi:MAG: DUF4145 domain-containing protein [Adhaeribacter sp.]